MDVQYSSNDSLVWTNASSDSQSSIDDTPNMKLNNCETESEHKTEALDDQGNASDRKKKKKAKKRKHDEESCDNIDSNPPKKKKVKIEPESDKEKSETEVNVAQSDSYVNLRIKQEDSHSTDEVKKKKKKHKKDKESMNDSELLNGSVDNSTLDITVDDSIRKKKKKKKTKHTDSEEETNRTQNENSYTIQNYEENEKDELYEAITDKPRRVMASTFIENDSNKSKVDETIINDISAIPSSASKKNTSISERLQFEDDEDINELESENRQETDNKNLFSREITKFLKINPTLTRIYSFAPFSTDDDDIWVVKCPTEIDITDFKGANLVLDGKSKIKVAGQTYDGTFDEVDYKQPIVTYSKKKVFLKNLSVLKTITFHKRIPVPHIQDDNVVMHDHSNFIPLPDTKCRHPLFGTNYKKAIKIPKSVGERLAVNDLQFEVIEEDLCKKKKKKHKKEKSRLEKEEVDASVNVKEEVESKKKKRKHKIKEEESVIKPAKRIKLEQDPGAWDSEKAIEENLFNF